MFLKGGRNMAVENREPYIPQDECDQKSAIKRFKTAYQELGVSALLKQCNIVKPTQGILKVLPVGVVTIFMTLLLLVFHNQSLTAYLNTHWSSEKGAKTTYYRFLNDPHYNWPKFLRELAYRVQTVCVSTIRKTRPCFYVMDDSIIPRMSSKHVELLSYIYDHVRNKTIKCFNNLVLAWTDGYSLLPVASIMMHSCKRLSETMDLTEKLHKRSSGYKERVKAGKSKLEVAVEMVRDALATGFRANYLLCDTWFTNEPFIRSMLELRIDVIGMLKDCKQQYWYRGKLYNLTGIRGLIHLDKGNRSGIWGSVIVQTKYSQIPVKIVFAQNRNKRSEYVLILSTDIDLTEEQIIQYYGNRWKIECCFKACKGFLGLGKEFHGLSYDLLISSTTIVYTRYLITEYIHRISTDHRTLNWWMKEMYYEVPVLEFADALTTLLSITVEAINKVDAKYAGKLRAKLACWYTCQPEHVRAILPKLVFKGDEGKADIPLPAEAV